MGAQIPDELLVGEAVVRLHALLQLLQPRHADLVRQLVPLLAQLTHLELLGGEHERVVLGHGLGLLLARGMWSFGG